jgi:uncharacterized protein
MDVPHALAIATVFLAAGCVKGITGMGLPTVAISLLGLWLTPVQAAALLVAPTLATNVAQCVGPHWRRLVVLLWPAWLTLAIVTMLAPGLGPSQWPVDPQRLLGLVLVLYGAWGLWRPALADLSGQSAGRHAGIAALVGAATGVVTAATSVFVLPLVPWLQALRLGKDEMIQALGLSFTVATVALALRLSAIPGVQLFSIDGAWALACAFVGLWAGKLVRDRLSGPAFQRGLFIAFLGLGLANLLRGS